MSVAPGPSRVDLVVEQVGEAICRGEIAPGTPLTIETLQRRTETSRSAVREALSVLTNLGLVRPRRRIGFEVCPASMWQLLSPEVMRWRLESDVDGRLTEELTALRALIEPRAAHLAAASTDDAARTTITEAAAELWAAAAAGDRDRFVAADALLHRAVLTAAGNSLFGALGDVMTTALPGRAPDADSISRERARTHLDLADAIARRDGPQAATLMSTIVEPSATPPERGSVQASAPTLIE